MSLIVEVFFNIIKFINKILIFFKKKNFINYLFDKLYSESITKIVINNNIVKMWTPSNFAAWSAQNFLGKRKAIEEFISNIPDKKDIVFWDIGANLGFYSLYCASKKQNVKIVAFECSSSAVLSISKNVSINNFHDKISIFPIGLTNVDSDFLILKEHSDSLGAQFNALNTEFELENWKYKNRYKIFSNNLSNLVDNKSLKSLPDYIKIDCDGLELEILEGFKKYLSDLRIKSIIIQMKFGPRIVDNKKFDDDKIILRSNKIYSLLEKCGFKSRHLEKGMEKKGQYLDIFER
tara:strand:+ start:223 stop:1098 length:876 start_codon:yes stop_codon:yes gene_type:complete